jgi:Protein of unknown function (DUF3298).
MKKKINIFKVLMISVFCILFVTISFNIRHLFKGNTKDIVLQNKTYKLTRESQKSYNVEIHYPKIPITSTECNAMQINTIIRDVAVSIFDSSYNEFVDNLERNLKDFNKWVEYETTYNILQSNSQYISFIFSVFAFDGGANPYVGSHIVTIDMKTGQYIHLHDLLDIEKLNTILLNGKFTVYEGTYSELDEDDVHDPKTIMDLTNTIKDAVAKIMPQEYNPFSSQNIGMDDKYLYVYVISNIGFHNYFILQVPLNLIFEEDQGKQETKITLLDEIYSLKRNENLQKNINVKINYPALTEPPRNDATKRINAILKDAAFLPFGETYNDAVAMLENIEKDFNQWIEAEINYDILQADEEYIRVIFSPNIISSNGNSNFPQYMILINVTTGQHILEILNTDS